MANDHLKQHPRCREAHGGAPSEWRVECWDEPASSLKQTSNQVQVDMLTLFPAKSSKMGQPRHKEGRSSQGDTVLWDQWKYWYVFDRVV